MTANKYIKIVPTFFSKKHVGINSTFYFFAIASVGVDLHLRSTYLCDLLSGSGNALSTSHGAVPAMMPRPNGLFFTNVFPPWRVIIITMIRIEFNKKICVSKLIIDWYQEAVVFKFFRPLIPKRIFICTNILGIIILNPRLDESPLTTTIYDLQCNVHINKA